MPLDSTFKDYQDSIDYRDIFRTTIMIVKILLSPSPILTYINCLPVFQSIVAIYISHIAM